MVTHRQFVRIFAEQCGGGADEAAPLWNNNKDRLSDMTMAEVRDQLVCP